MANSEHRLVPFLTKRSLLFLDTVIASEAQNFKTSSV